MGIPLHAIVEALEFQSDESRVFLDRQTGEVHAFGPDELRSAETDEDPSDFPDWQQPLVALARQVFSDSSGRFVELPDPWDIHEYRALEGFATSQTDPTIADQLLSAIRGRGAFRHFKDAIHRLGIADTWYTYRGEFLQEIARDWCQANDIPYTEGS
jgi:hypothetical protein